MLPPDSSRHATRRRVRVFVGLCLLAVLAVGLWPTRGYHVYDLQAFVNALDSPQLRPRNSWKPLNQEGAANISLHEYPSYREARKSQEKEASGGMPRVTLPQGEVLFSQGFGREFYYHYRYRNLIVVIIVDERDDEYPPNTSRDTFVSACLAKILPALDAHTPGVDVENMPPAFQFWRGDIQPFLQKLFP